MWNGWPQLHWRAFTDHHNNSCVLLARWNFGWLWVVDTDCVYGFFIADNKTICLWSMVMCLFGTVAPPICLNWHVFFSLQKQDPKPNSRLIDLRSDRVGSVSTRLMNKHNICPCTFVLPLAYPTYVLIILVCMFWFVAAVVTQINGVERRPWSNIEDAKALIYGLNFRSKV